MKIPLIFRDIYFHVGKGERIGLIGRNGAGKSTVFKLIIGKEEPTSGKVEVDPKVKVSYFSQFSELSGTNCLCSRSWNVLRADLANRTGATGSGSEAGPSKRMIGK